MITKIPTAHINCADASLIAETVLMPGDPLRAKFIADTYLENVIQFTSVRNMFGFTGYYKGKKISVMGSGMGMSSIGIYSYELYNFYGVKNIIRIGSCGGYVPELKLRDIVLVERCWTDSNFAQVFSKDSSEYAYPSDLLVEKIEKSAEELGIKCVKCTIHSSDLFYHLETEYRADVLKKGCQAVEMESFALFTVAKALKKNAACLLTVSDSFCYDEEMSSKDRETKFTDMIEVALKCVD